MSGIIGTSKSKSGVVGRDLYTTGMVLQTINDIDRGTERSSSSNTYVDAVGLVCVITTRGHNSKFFINVHSGMSYTSTSANMNVNIKRVITGGATMNEIMQNLGGQSYYYGITHSRVKQWAGMGFFHIDTPLQAVGTTLTYSVRYHGDNQLVNWLHAYGSASIMVQEIAA